MYRHSRLVTKAIHLLVVISILSTSAPITLSAAPRPRFTSTTSAEPVTVYPDSWTFSMPEPLLEETLSLPGLDTSEASEPVLQVSDSITLTLRAVPRHIPADGTAEAFIWVRARDENGDPVPDGTQLTASTSLRQLARRRTRTRNGIARFTLVAAQEPGRAIVVVRLGDTRRRVAIRFVHPRQLGTRLDDIPQDSPFDPNDVAEAARHPMTLDQGVATAEGESYAVRFDSERMVFTQTLSGGTGDIGLGFSLLRVRVGDQVLYERPGIPSTVRVRKNRAIVQRFPALREVYVALDQGVKQNFVLREPVGAGNENLVLVGELDTSPANLDPRYRSNEEGIVFLDEQGHEVLAYTGVIVRDELGKETVARMRLNGQRVRIIIPGGWLAQAEYPVVIDPLVGDSIQVNNLGYGLAAAYNSDADEWLVVWRGPVPGADGLRGQRVRSDGTLVGDDFVVASISSGFLRYHTVAYNSAAGEYLVAWTDTRTGAWRLYGQRVNANGTLSGSEIAICTDPNSQLVPAVAYQAGTEEWLLVWDSYRTSGEIKTYGRYISSSGELLESEFPISQGGYTRGGQAIAADEESGENLVVWHISASGQYSLRARRVLPDGTFLGDEFIVASVGYDSPLSKVTYNSNDDEYLIVWQNDDSGDWDILGQRVSADGILLGTPTTIISASGDQTEPNVAWDEHSGQYLVIWQESDHIAGQQLLGDGTLDGEVLNLLASGSSPAMSYGSESGLFLVVGKVSNQIYAQRYAISGVGFSAAPLSGTAPLTVDFVYQSTGDYDTCTWDFGDGSNPVETTETTIAHTYTAIGIYDVTLTVEGPDGSDTLTRMAYITVSPNAPTVLEIQIVTGNDDAEENTSGSIDLTSSDLELIRESSEQTVGLRFNGVDIPPGVTVIQAYLQFQVDESTSETTVLTIEGQAGDDAPVFSTASGNISSRTRTTAAATWNPAAWNTIGEAGPDQRTTDVSTVVQEIVGRPGWSGGNSLVLIITGSGRRMAESYNGSSSGAPLLHVEFTATAPQASFIASPTSGSFPLTVVFTNTTTGNYDACTWDFGDGTTSPDCNDPSHPYTSSGAYTVSLTVTGPDGSDELIRTDYIVVTDPVQPPTADFVATTPTEGNIPLTVAFDNTSTNTTTYAWDFGDSSPPSTEENPAHTYTQPGVYTVTLDASDGTLTDTLVRPAYVQATALDQGLQGHWRLDEESGTRYDNSSHSNNLTDHNTVGSTMGQVGLAGDFERSNSERLSIDHSVQNGLNITGSLTLVGWIKPEIVDQQQFPF